MAAASHGCLAALCAEDDLMYGYLEAAIHATLHVRGVYPAELFEVRKVMNMPVHISRHPSLKKYVRDAVLSIREARQLEAVERVELVLLAANPEVPTAEHEPFERHVFELGPPRTRGGERATDDELEDVERNLRASLAQIGRLGHRLPAIPPQTSFAIIVLTPESADLTQQEDLSVSAKWVHEGRGREAPAPRREVHAVKQVSRGHFFLSHYVETSSAS